jgi:hypothetical protein
MPVELVSQSDEMGFRSMLTELGLDRMEFALTLTKYPEATYGPRVKTIKISWKNMLEAEYGAAETTSWVKQFRADWENGTIPGIVADNKAAQNGSAHPAT